MPIKKLSEAELSLLISAMETLIESREPEYKQCSKDLGFLWFLTVDQFSYFYSEYKKGGTSSGWTAVEELFSRPEVIATITECIFECSLVRKRKQIIKRGLRAHLDHDYIASVSELIRGLPVSLSDTVNQQELTVRHKPLSFFYPVVKVVWTRTLFSSIGSK